MGVGPAGESVRSNPASHPLTSLRIRKVKCDEEFPSCHRCVSTGRLCDGYGIRGGGGAVRGAQPVSAAGSGTDIDLASP